MVKPAPGTIAKALRPDEEEDQGVVTGPAADDHGVPELVVAEGGGPQSGPSRGEHGGARGVHDSAAEQ